MPALAGLERREAERSETDRSARPASAPPNLEVRAKAQLRKYSAFEKLSVVERVDAAKEEGGGGAPLRDSRDEESYELHAQVGRLEQKVEQAALITDVQKNSCDAAGHLVACDERERRICAVLELVSQSSCLAACTALAVSRTSFYRWRRPMVEQPVPQRKSSRALSSTEAEAVFATLHSERFADQAPPQVYAKLLDEGVYICSSRTMYRLLSQAGEIEERRNQLRHPTHQRPELLATAPNQLWNLDITKVRGPAK